jgi:hypothetical protein
MSIRGLPLRWDGTDVYLAKVDSYLWGGKKSRYDAYINTPPAVVLSADIDQISAHHGGMGIAEIEQIMQSNP